MNRSDSHGGDSRHAPSPPLVLSRVPTSAASVGMLAVTAMAFVAVWSIVGLAAFDDGSTVFDLAIFDHVAAWRTDTVVTIAHLATWLASSMVSALLACTIIAVNWFWTRRWDIPILVILAVAGSTVITGAIKVLTDRERPGAALVDVSSSAFPSGHTVRAAAIFGLLAWIVARTCQHAARRVFIGILLIVPAGVAASRVVLDAHWATDVIAGGVLGAAWLMTCIAVTRPTRVTDS